MNMPTTRRRFLGAAAALGAASLTNPAALFANNASRSPAAKIKLGFDNFSIRAFDWKAPKLIEYAASLGVDTLLLSDLDVYESLEPAYLEKIAAQAKAAGVEVQAGTGSICPTSNSYKKDKWGKAEDHARLLIRTAKSLGTSVARCYLGNRRDRDTPGGIDRHIEETVKVLHAVKSEAEDAGVKLAVENHAGDMQAWELVQLIEAAGKGHVGATMDSGNATWTIEDPMVNLELLGPYAVTCGLRDSAVWETSTGSESMWTNVGTGVIDWPAYIKRFGELCPEVSFVLELISYRWSNQAAYLTPEFWKRFPKARAHEFARFVALAKRGKKFDLPAGRPGHAGRPAKGESAKKMEQAQQKFDLEQSLAYCRKLGLGRRDVRG